VTGTRVNRRHPLELPLFTVMVLLNDAIVAVVILRALAILP
jgi:hypothetical protein